MPTYHEAMTTNLSKLTTAATQWDKMAGEYKKLETQYKKEVHGITMGETWQGLSANAAQVKFGVTLNEFRAAQKEAKAIASLLRDAHAQFVDLRSKLKSKRAEAIKAGMKVSEQGYVSFDTTQLTNGELTAYQHDPSYQESARKAASEWNQAIELAVKAISDADDGVKIALEAVTVDTNFKDGTFGGFNGKAQGDIEKYEADEAKDIAMRINEGKASTRDYQELQRLFRDNSDDKHFSQTLLDRLGARGTLKLSNDLESLGHYDDKKHAGRYQNLERGLATTLATATRDPDSAFYKDFRADMQKVGGEPFKIDGLSPIPDEKVRGYQSLVTLMQEGRGYSGQFLKDTADDIRKAEESYASKGHTESIWSLRDDFSGKDRGWFANDPLDGVLGVMSEDPKTSTEYLDPEHSDNLKYLLNERDWDTVVDHHAIPPGGTTTGMPIMTEDGDAMTGFGAALEAGATGQEPGTPLGKPEPHSEGQARLMQATIANLDEGAEGDTVHENLKVPLGRALSDYTADTHSILGGYAPNSPAGQDHIAGSGDNASIANSKESLLRVMRGVSDGVVGTNSDGDPIRVFDTLYEGQRGYAAEYLDTGRQVPQSSLTENVTSWDNRSRHVGEAFGSMNAIGTDMVLDVRDAEVGKINDQARYAYHGVGSLANFIPQIGDIAQRSLDAATYEWSKDVINEKENIARAEVSKETASGITGTNNLIDSWADTRDAKGSDAVENAKGEAKQSYITGREEAYSALRTRK